MRTDVHELEQRLFEVGCGENLSEQVAALICAEDRVTARLLLRRYRKQLMDELHNCQKRVDRLDLLIYQMDKNKL